MRIAFTSSDGERIDQHFGMASGFDVWEVGPDRAERVERVSAITTSGASHAAPGAPGKEGGFAAGSELDEEDRITARARAIAGCTIVYTVQIGGPAAAKLVAGRIHPMKTGAEVPIAEVVAKLQAVLRGNPPPWLKKAMGGGASAPAEKV